MKKIVLGFVFLLSLLSFGYAQAANKIVIDLSQDPEEAYSLDLIADTSWGVTPIPTLPHSIYSSDVFSADFYSTERDYAFMLRGSYSLQDGGDPQQVAVEMYWTSGPAYCHVNGATSTEVLTDKRIYQVNTELFNPGTDNSTECTITFSSEEREHHMDVVIRNQIGRSQGTGQYSYILEEGKSEITRGEFASDIVSTIGVNQDVKVATIFTIDGADSFYKGNVRYVFDDYLMSGIPSGLKVKLDNSFEEISDWCKAGIIGWNQGYRLYDVTTTVTGDEFNSVCTVSITSQDNPEEPKDFAFVQIDALPTEGIEEWEYVVGYNGSEHILAAANIASTNSDYIKHNTFRWDSNSGQFVPLNNLLVGERCVDSSYKEVFKDHAVQFKYIGDYWSSISLIMTNRYTHPLKPGQVQVCDTTKVDYKASSYIYEWVYPGEFNVGEGCCEFITTDAAWMWEFISSGGEWYVVLIERGLDEYGEISVYKVRHNGYDFESTKIEQPNLPNFNVLYIDNIGGSLLVSSNVPNQESVLYEFDSNGILIEKQSSLETPGYLIVPEGGVEKSHDFGFIAFTYQPDQAPDLVKLYKYEYVEQYQTNLYVSFQDLPNSFKEATAYARVSTTFPEDYRDFMIVSLGRNGVDAYLWNEDLNEFDTTLAFKVWPEGDNVLDVKELPGLRGSEVALAVNSDRNGNFRTHSPILRWQEINNN